MTRVQKERFFNEEDYIRMKDFYILDRAKLNSAPAKMLLSLLMIAGRLELFTVILLFTPAFWNKKK